MSMRDFITRVLNTPVVVGTPSPIVVEIPPTIVVETHFDPPSPRKGSSKNDVPFYWDIESRSAAVLGSGKQGVGARAYAEHPTTEVLCVSYARGDGPIETWVPGQPIPEVATAAAVDPRSPWAAHGAAFERAMLERILVPLHGWPMVPVERHVCTMSLALAHAYPGSLEAVAEILGGEPQGCRQGEDGSCHVEAAQAATRGGSCRALLGRYAGATRRTRDLQQAGCQRRT